MSILRDWERDLLGPPPSTPVFTDTKKILSAVVSAPEYSPVDDYGWIHGAQFSINVLLPEMMKIDLSKLGPDFQAPVLFFEGRHDPYCPPSLIWEYSQAIKAPHKEFIWFDNAAISCFLKNNRNLPMNCSRKFCLSPTITQAAISEFSFLWRASTASLLR